MSQLHDEFTEQIAAKLAHYLHRNWVIVETMVMVELKTKLTKREAIEVAKRALEIMEEKHL